MKKLILIIFALILTIQISFAQSTDDTAKVNPTLKFDGLITAHVPHPFDVTVTESSVITTTNLAQAFITFEKQTLNGLSVTFTATDGSFSKSFTVNGSFLLATLPINKTTKVGKGILEGVSKVKLNTAGLANGVYFIKLNNNNITKTIKFIL